MVAHLILFRSSQTIGRSVRVQLASIANDQSIEKNIIFMKITIKVIKKSPRAKDIFDFPNKKPTLAWGTKIHMADGNAAQMNQQPAFQAEACIDPFA